jgi:2-(1,2-epoxy-1,2-dihydrophenyl)acetyl-CoA isomerase
MTSFIIHERTDNVVTLTLNAPNERNAIGSREACEEIARAAEAVNSDPSVHAVVLTGAGTAFCAGGNIKTIAERSGFARGATPAATRENYRAGVQRAISAVWNVQVPTIAAVNGPAIGLGCDLACACDLRVAASSAAFAESFLKLGLVPGDGGAWFLPRVVGYAKAVEMTFTADTLSAADALTAGLVSKVVPAEHLLREAHALAQRIAAQPRLALRLAKRLLRESQHARLAELLELSAAYQAIAHESEDHAEAVAALRVKRAPHFNGR